MHTVVQRIGTISHTLLESAVRRNIRYICPPCGIWLTAGGYQAGPHLLTGRNEFNNKNGDSNGNVELCCLILNLQSGNGSRSNTYRPISIENYSRLFGIIKQI